MNRQEASLVTGRKVILGPEVMTVLVLRVSSFQKLSSPSTDWSDGSVLAVLVPSPAVQSEDVPPVSAPSGSSTAGGHVVSHPAAI